MKMVTGAHFIRQLRPFQTSDLNETYRESRQHRADRSCQFSSKSVAPNYHFFSDKRELVVSPYEATSILLWALRAQTR